VTDQEQARERAAQKLAHLIAAHAAVADPLAIARDFITEMTTPNNYGTWRYVLATPGITPVTPNPDAYERGAPLAREALQRRMDNTDA
jgi:hypothetical protein